jgi:hypothetical protein
LVGFSAARDFARALKPPTVAEQNAVGRNKQHPPGFSQAVTFFGRATRPYAHIAGIESGYGFFAPNVPPAYRLAIVIERPQGVMSEKVLSSENIEINLRLTTLVDYIARTQLEPVRQLLIQRLTFPLSSDAGALKVYIVVSRLQSPSLQEYVAGARGTWMTQYEYEWSDAASRPSD